MTAPSWSDAFRDSAVARGLWASSLGRSGEKESVRLPVRRLMAAVDGPDRSFVVLLPVAGHADQASAPRGFYGQQSP